VKLLLCLKCQDVQKLAMYPEAAWCSCRSSWGQYVNDLDAEFGGEHAMLLGIHNSSLAHAIRDQLRLGDITEGWHAGLGRKFEAFIIPESAPTVRREGKAPTLQSVMKQ
jgi:hypothetical protein